MVRRPRPVGDRVVPDQVDALSRVFKYPEPEPAEAAINIFGGGGGAPSVVIAASDASDLSKGKADYICPGSNDQDVIQAAITALGIPTSPFQGYRILLTEGTFDIKMGSAAFGAIRLDYGSIQGMGKEATYLNVTEDPATDDNPVIDIATSRGTVRDLAIQGGSSVRATGAYLQGFDNLVTNCLFGTNGYGVAMNDAEQSEIAFCDFEGDRGIWFEDSDQVTIIANYISPSLGHGIDLTTSAGAANRIRIVGNEIIAGVTDQHGIYVDGTFTDSVIADNYIAPQDGHGIYLNGSDIDDLVISANIINPDKHGIWVSGASGCQISDNLILDPGGHADNTFDGIFLDADSDNNFIHGNTITAPAAGNLPRYAINVSAATCDCNIVVANRLGDPADYGTDALNDAGTDTQLFWPNDVTYGDNFTDCGGSS